ncbi:NAD(P)H-dependent oxidoreductase [Microvirga arsenatis]|uniref:Flavodoxin family protein n=1 Tax=Microvirga arsenatis TaxID=2692265 RepID=A0ABW9YZD9_9HYPH|nr:NAD(P)H-dependent oxidoreductase [Microvirga arsenatis]NBJ11317.1 flavodoxin family protein [Microvirga arsenatis]NBJ25590.1 flavodoxin family protein [Microvirga arsenatis]
MPKTLILVAHPQMDASRANKALLAAVWRRPGIEIVDLYDASPDGQIDVEAQVRLLLDADRIVLQFPMQWYSTPPLLKEWQDQVLTRMIYLAFEREGRLLEGKPILVAVTAGAPERAYAPDGSNRFSVAELLKPLEATAHRCGLQWQEPFVLYDSRDASDEALRLSGERYAGRLCDLSLTLAA